MFHIEINQTSTNDTFSHSLSASGPDSGPDSLCTEVCLPRFGSSSEWETGSVGRICQQNHAALAIPVVDSGAGTAKALGLSQQ